MVGVVTIIIAMSAMEGGVGSFLLVDLLNHESIESRTSDLV